MNKIRKGDEVVVITGKDKGRRGKVSAVLATGKLLVDGINVVKKHQKPNPQANVGGGIVDQEMPIQASNVMLWNPATEKGDRIGFKQVGAGASQKKVRVFKSNGEVVDR
jgi:large subunit ribosomal protein L24